MPWLKKAGEAPTTDKIWELSDPLYRLYDGALHYCARELTDGHIPANRISPLTPKPATKQQIEALVVRRLWHRLPDICSSCLNWRKVKEAGPLPRGGYVVHDYLEFNPSRIQWERRHEVARTGGHKGAQARWGMGQPMAEPIGQGVGETYRSGHDPLTTTPDRSTYGSTHGPYSVPRTSVTRDSDTGGAGGDEPAIPDEPSTAGPGARGATDRKRSGTTKGGLHHIGVVARKAAQ